MITNTTITHYPNGNLEYLREYCCESAERTYTNSHIDPEADQCRENAEDHELPEVGKVYCVAEYYYERKDKYSNDYTVLYFDENACHDDSRNAYMTDHGARECLSAEITGKRHKEVLIVFGPKKEGGDNA